MVCILTVALCFLAQLYGSRREARLIQDDMVTLEVDLSDEIKQGMELLEVSKAKKTIMIVMIVVAHCTPRLGRYFIPHTILAP